MLASLVFASSPLELHHMLAREGAVRLLPNTCAYGQPSHFFFPSFLLQHLSQLSLSNAQAIEQPLNPSFT